VTVAALTGVDVTRGAVTGVAVLTPATTPAALAPPAGNAATRPSAADQASSDVTRRTGRVRGGCIAFLRIGTAAGSGADLDQLLVAAAVTLDIAVV